MKTTITFSTNERVERIFKKVTGYASQKLSSQLLALVLESLLGKYTELYIGASTLDDVEKIDEQLTSEINSLLKIKETLHRDPIKLPTIPTVSPYQIPPYINPVERRPFDITYLSTQS